MTDARPAEDDIAHRRQLVDGATEGATWRQGLVSADDDSETDTDADADARSGAVGGPLARRAVRSHGDSWLERHWSSRTLHRFGEVVAHAGAGLGAAAAVLVWLVVGVVTGFPDWWETVLYATSASVTLVMVFAIQHTQTRQESAIQRKLDELLRSEPGADNKLIAVEEAPDQELEARATLNLADRQVEPKEQPTEGT